MTRSLFLSLLVLVVLHGCSESAPLLSISQLQVIAPAPGRTASVAYLTISNHGRDAIELLAVSSPDFAVATMHQTQLLDGVARMLALASVTINAESSVAFAPGGKHIMLFDPTKGLTPGTQVSLQFEFSTGEILMLTAALKTRVPVE